MSDNIYIEANDCSPFPNQDMPGFANAIKGLLETVNDSEVFRFSDSYTPSEGDYVVNYNYLEKQWWSGRFVGEAIIPTPEGDFHFKIKPRFGELFLFRLIEEIFNIQLKESKTDILLEDSFDNLIKRIISFIWLRKLAIANKHGLPKTNIICQHQGYTIKGRVDVRKSIRPYFKTEQIVSTHREKQLDKTIASILTQAFQILKIDYGLGMLSIPDNALDAIIQLESSDISKNFISQHDYHNIRYKAIYQSFKQVIDFSWDIIKKKRISSKSKSSQKPGYAFFIDIAELWELYLQSVLKKNLSNDGWVSANNKWSAYKGEFYERKLIPDIVMEKGNSVMIWDAKYKKMQFRRIDVDRGDFFQIHTYLQYYLNQKHVIAGGLLYPLENQHRSDAHYSGSLLSQNGVDTKFSIDGIDFSFLKDWKGSKENAMGRIQEEERKFVDRIKTLAES